MTTCFESVSKQPNYVRKELILNKNEAHFLNFFFTEIYFFRLRLKNNYI